MNELKSNWETMNNSKTESITSVNVIKLYEQKT